MKEKEKEGIFYYYGGLENLVLYGITKEEYKKIINKILTRGD